MYKFFGNFAYWYFHDVESKLIKCSAFLPRIRTIILMYNFFFPDQTELNSIFAFANKQLFDGEIKIFIFCLILVCHNKDA